MMQSKQVIRRTTVVIRLIFLCDTNIVDTVHCAVISFMAMVLCFLLEVEGGHRGHGSSLCVVMIQREGAESLGSISFVLVTVGEF